MFNRLRLVLTGQFILLSLSVYVVLTASALALFHHGLSEIIDERLRELSFVAEAAVGQDGDRLFLNEGQSAVALMHKRLSIQLWHPNRTIASVYGTTGIPRFTAGDVELAHEGLRFRSMSSPIIRNGKTIGYLQVQVDTGLRDEVFFELLEAAMISGPFLIIALGVCGYWFAGLAIRPVRQTYDLQKRFLSDAGHELKTPVAVIEASSEILEQDLQDSPESLERLRRIKRSADRMRNLVADLLLLTKTEQGNAPLEMETVSLDMLIREILGQFSDLYEDKGVDLIANDIDEIRLRGNHQSLVTIFSNLLKNALMYTDEGGSVTLSLKNSGNSAVTTVTDTGAGISAENLEKLFDRFFRVDESRSREDGGSGLGLAIVNAMVENHKGTINVQSELGKGTTFIVTIPIS